MTGDGVADIRDGPRRLRSTWPVLLALPLLFACVAATFLHLKGPFWLGTNLDPDYQYLLNALNLALGHTSYHTDHPGQPPQLIAALVMRIMHAIIGRQGITDDVLDAPERYLTVITVTFIALYVLTSVLVGWLTWRKTGRVAPALFVQGAPLLSATNFVNFVCVKPEPVLLILATVFTYLVVSHVVTPVSRRSQRWHAVAFGCVVGIAIASKVTAAPLALLPLLILPGMFLRLLYVGVSVAAFFVSVIPILSRFEEFTGFIARLASHTGRYGGGQPGYIDLGRYGPDLLQVLLREGAFALLVLASVSVYAWVAARRRAAPGDQDAILARRAERALGALILSQIIALLIAGRHMHETRYLIPLMGMAGLNVALAFFLLPERRHRAVLSVVTLALLCYGSISLGRAGRELLAVRDDQLAVRKLVEEKFSDCTIVYHYRASSLPFALSSADKYAGDRFWQPLYARWPGMYFYNVFVGRFYTFRSFISYDDVRPRDCVIMQGSIDSPPYYMLPEGLRGEPLYKGKVEGLLRIRGEVVKRPATAPATQP